ncbi:MAG: ABC transporter substrate-binding protein [Sporomusaceae bacterium]|nr:ABC transporter substrate-binding protein [Sporomusaceae bacterium]
MRKSRLYSCFFSLLTAVIFVALSGLSPVGAAPAAPTSPAADPIRIGGNFDLSGRYAYFGEMVVMGAKLAFKEVNDAGGVLGRKIEFVPLDNASDKAKAAVVMKSLAARGNVSAVLGCLTIANTSSAYVIAEQNRIPLVSPTAGGFMLTGSDGKVKPYAFLTCFSDNKQAGYMARFAFEELGAKKAAIVYNDKADFSRMMATAFEQVFAAFGGKIVAKEQIGSGEEASQEYVAQIRQAEPEVVFIPLNYREAGQTIRGLRESGIGASLLGPDMWDSPRIAAYAGEEALNDIYFFYQYAASKVLPKVDKFFEAFEKEYKRPPGSEAAMGYEAAVVLVEAIRKAGNADPESVRAALEGIEAEGLLGTIRIDAADHNVVKSVTVYRMIEGQSFPYRMLKP